MYTCRFIILLECQFEIISSTAASVDAEKLQQPSGQGHQFDHSPYTGEIQLATDSLPILEYLVICYKVLGHLHIITYLVPCCPIAKTILLDFGYHVICRFPALI